MNNEQNTHKCDLSLCVWSDLKKNDIDQLNSCKDPDEVHRLLMSFLELCDDPQSEILIDLYKGAYFFARSHNFDEPQISTLISIFIRTHNVCTLTPYGNFDECFNFFKNLLILHSVHRPPWTLKIFTVNQVEDISTYVINTYFRHFKMYKYAFTAKIHLDLAIKYEGVPEAPPIDFEEVNLDIKPLEIEDNSNLVSNIEDRKAENELESLIKQAIADQLKLLNISVEKQLEETDKIISEKIQTFCRENDENPNGKSAKKTGKTKSK